MKPGPQRRLQEQVQTRPWSVVNTKSPIQSRRSQMADPVREAFKPQRTDLCFCNSGRRFKSCCGSMAEERAPPFGMHLVPAFLERNICNQWVAELEKQNRELVSIVDHHQSTPEKAVLRRDETRITERVEAGPLKEKVQQVIGQAVTAIIADSTGRLFSWFIGPQILRYQRGGRYDLHTDSDHWSAAHGAWVKGLDRDISLLLYLNDDFTGGELDFPVFNYRYHPRPGDLLFFPSDCRYRHRANVVQSGVRYAIASWAAFRGEPRVQAQRPENRIDLDS